MARNTLAAVLTLLLPLPTAAQEPPPAAKEPLALQAEMTGALLVERFEALTGLGVATDDETRRLLRDAHLWATAPIEAPAERAVPVLEALLDALAFRLVDRGAGEAPRYELDSLDTQARGREDGALELTPGQLPTFAPHAALFVRCALRFEGFDPRVWFNTLRPLLPDPARLVAWPEPDGDALVVRGSAGRVARFAGLLDAVTRAGAEVEGSVPAQVGATRGWSFPREGGAPPDLAQLAREYTEATGLVLLANDETLRLLESCAPSPSKALEVAAADLPRFFEELLESAHFLVTELHSGTPRMALIESLDTTARGVALTGVQLVPADAQGRLSAFPARLFATVLRLPGSDARRLANSLRSWLGEEGGQLALPLGDGETLLVTGRSDEFARLRKRIGWAHGELPPRAPGLPVGDGELRIVPDEEGWISAQEVLAALERWSGTWTVGLGRDALAGQRLFCSGPLDLTAEQAWEGIQALLWERGILLEARALLPPPAALALTWSEWPTRRAGTLPRLVPASELTEHARDAALSIECLLPTDGVDARRLSAELRDALPRTGGVELGAFGDEPLLWMSGPGRAVASVGELLDAAQGRRVGKVGDAPWDVHAASRFASLDGERAWRTLDELAFDYGRATGQRVVMTEEVARYLWGERVDLEPLRALSVEALPRAFEELLLERGFSRVELTAPPARIVGLRRAPGEGRIPDVGEARFVPLERLDACAEHPATLFATVLPLEHGRARTLAQPFRARRTDANAVRIVPLSDPPAVVVQALGAVLPRLAEELRAADRARDEQR